MFVTDHAVERYIERVKPHLSDAEAREELKRLLPLAEVDRHGPPWCSDPGRADSFALLSDGIVFPLLHGRVMSCLTRSEVGAELRIVKAKERREQRERRNRKGTQEKHGKVAREARRRARDARGQAA